MKNNQTFRKLIAAAFVAAAILVSCQKETQTNTPAGTTNLSVYITDGPVNFDNAFIDIQLLEVKIENDSCGGTSHDSNDDHGSDAGDDNHSSNSGTNDNSSSEIEDNTSCEKWDTLQINAGVYDLLKFRNGVDALLASNNIPKGQVKAVRLTLGNNNSVVIDSISHPMELKENKKVTLKIADLEITDINHSVLHLDFDLAQSIEFKDSRFELRPRIKSFNDKKAAKIEGMVLPGSAKTTVTLTGNKDSLTAIASREGEFKIRGIQSTSFSLHFAANAGGYKDTTISGLSLSSGGELKIPIVTLHK